MASDSVKKWQVAPFVWTFATIAFACITGYCLAHGSQLWVVMIICSVSCGLMISRSLMRISKRIRYVMEATLNGDFSYKFPTADINEDDRSTNEMLNQIVEQSERLPLEAIKQIEKYRKDSDDRIIELFKAKDDFIPNRKFVEGNQKESLAQVFTDIRYPESVNTEVSTSFLSLLKEKGFLK